MNPLCILMYLIGYFSSVFFKMGPEVVSQKICKNRFMCFDIFYELFTILFFKKGSAVSTGKIFLESFIIYFSSYLSLF